ncbi:hypothetical protein [Shewanella gelidimarina]|nr:hypothetical protein [Shewanella gelidimarina]
MSFSHSPQIAYNTVKIAKKRGPRVRFNISITALRAFRLAS